MMLFGKTLQVLHLLALGLWLGSITFFSFFTALPIIHRMQQLASRPDNWIGLGQERDGTRLAGEALDAVFARYFPFQVGCGVVAVLTATVWVAAPGAVNKIRVIVLAVAVALALLNLFYLAPTVHQLRLERYSVDPAIASAGERDFGKWHSLSLSADMATLVLVVVGMVLAAFIPGPARNN